MKSATSYSGHLGWIRKRNAVLYIVQRYPLVNIKFNGAVFKHYRFEWKSRVDNFRDTKHSSYHLQIDIDKILWSTFDYCLLIKFNNNDLLIILNNSGGLEGEGA